MKKYLWLIPPVLLSGYLLLGANKVPDDPVFPELNADIETLVLAVESEEGKYMQANSRYMQILQVADIPIKGDTVIADYSKKPYYQSEDISNKGLPATLPFTYSVTQYLTPSGEVGYEIIFWLKNGGKVFRKSIGYGSEALRRTSNWIEQ